MICTKCQRHLTLCICDDIDRRLDELARSPVVAIDYYGIKAVRMLNRYDIKRDREAAEKGAR